MAPGPSLSLVAEDRGASWPRVILPGSTGDQVCSVGPRLHRFSTGLAREKPYRGDISKASSILGAGPCPETLCGRTPNRILGTRVRGSCQTYRSRLPMGTSPITLR